ncbi:hypothetical protein ASG37_09660 [Sphingomonas sp. Leaf407]|nr:hypothetical protein ASE97_06950 [Sphingomonas sp. Leaf42]KQT28170.1 hypothetical protein ASG37_09660 [Sphingomonas sp. Leaf407]
MPMPQEIKRYTVRLVSVMTLYGVALVGVNLWFRYSAPTGALAYLAAVLPAMPIALVFVVIGRLLVEMHDEYLRAQMVRDILVATGVTLSITTALGFLEGFDLIGHVRGYYAATIWFGALGVATCTRTLASLRGSE